MATKKEAEAIRKRAAYDAAVLAAAKPKRRAKTRAPVYRPADEDFNGAPQPKKKTPAQVAKEEAANARRSRMTAAFDKPMTGPGPAIDPHDPEDVKRIADSQLPQELVWRRAHVQTARDLVANNPGDAACAAYLANEEAILAILETEADRPERIMGW